MALFQSAVLNKYLKEQDSDRIAAAYAAFTEHFHDPVIQANIRDSKEEQYQEGFLRDLFVHVLGYTLNPQKGFELTTEFKNEKGAKKADGAILVDGKALAVIELKGTDTTDLATINAQAFNYKANHSHCVYVVTSNFHKLRFFIDNAVEHIEFDLFALGSKDFELLWLCLQRDNLLGGIPKKVKAESLQEEEKVTKRLYRDYSTFKNALWQDLCTQHPEHDKLLLYKKSQKLLDRFLFVLFSEDKGLLPPNTLRGILDQWHKLTELDEYRPLYERCQKYFGYLNTGYKSGTQDIFAYNGGLFKPDELLDNVHISDAVLEVHLDTLTKYDFASEVDVNILGHIFEHSLNDIENITAQLEGRAVDAKKTKRKKDGVFYTPKYITQYIVEHTVGRLCTEKKDELAIVDEEYAKGRKGRQKKTIQELDTKLDVYRDWLLALTICDPACGSGAFLNQALDFLITEHRYVDELQASLLGHSITFKDIGDHILERNIYGVDINEESVEIARLSLWLRTATKGRKLNDLSSNIKCGNSLIDDPAVAGDKAFDWKKEFPNVFAKGGFDVVVGNPPYVLCQQTNTAAAVLDTYKRFEVASYKIDLFHLFFEKSIHLLRSNGRLGFITPNTYLTNKHISPLRRHILKSASIETIVKHDDTVFEDATVDVATITLVKSKAKDHIVHIMRGSNQAFLELSKKPQAEWEADPNAVFNLETRMSMGSKETVPLGDLCETYFGIQAFDRNTAIRASKETANCLPVIDGGDIFPFCLAVPNKFFDYRPENIKSGGDWKVYERKRLVVRQIGQVPIVGVCEAGVLASNTLYSIYPKQGNLDLNYLLLILNSGFIRSYWRSRFSDSKQLFPKIKGYQLKELPIRLVPLVEQHRFAESAIDMVEWNTKLFALQNMFLALLRSKYSLLKISRTLEQWPTLEFKEFLKELKKAKVTLTLAEEAEWLGYFSEQQAKAHALQAEIDRTDAAIDALVYQLYGLTEEEVKVVEGK